MKKLILASGFWLLASFSFASDNCIPSKPSPPRLVNNLSQEFPDFLSADEEQMLENKLVQFSKETSNQIVIVIVDDLCGYDPNEFCTRLGEQWGVGQGKFDNGIVIMIKPTGGSGQRDAYIASGYGLEGVVPDATAKRIVENEIIPQFKNGNFYNGLDAATDVLISLAKKEFNYQDYQKNNQQSLPWFFIGVFILILLFVFVFKNSRGHTITSGGRTYYGGGWGSFGGGGFGGGSSGGFGGFGGGSFGGGGAGGSW
ncbi:MAG: TPM domain-containing protein [Bacteroidetes bacterium]|nr:TPM domain-containing protein [Bacteroidota bacterium]